MTLYTFLQSTFVIACFAPSWLLGQPSSKSITAGGITYESIDESKNIYGTFVKKDTAGVLQTIPLQDAANHIVAGVNGAPLFQTTCSPEEREQLTARYIALHELELKLREAKLKGLVTQKEIENVYLLRQLEDAEKWKCGDLPALPEVQPVKETPQEPASTPESVSP